MYVSYKLMKHKVIKIVLGSNNVVSQHFIKEKAIAGRQVGGVNIPAKMTYLSEVCDFALFRPIYPLTQRFDPYLIIKWCR